MPPGRFLRTDGHLGQVAITNADSDAVDALADALRARDDDVRDGWPRRIEPLPRAIRLADALARSPIGGAVTIPLLLGVGAEQHQLVVIDLERGQPGVFVGGPAGSGRTTALATMATLLVERGIRVGVIDPRRSGLAAVVGVEFAAQGPAATAVDPTELADADVQVVFVDDADLLDGQLAAHVELASGAAAIPLVAAFTRDTITGAATGWIGQLRRNRSGLLLHPQSRYDAAVFGATTLDDSMTFSGPPGRGVVGVGGRLGVVQVPTP
jgi:S-DNA-T family DNA segregation ATPase FtsK/SpoIIIE